VIDENGEQIGVLLTAEALELARGKELNLVEVAPRRSQEPAHLGAE
jgi:translation initiation factor IF-3